MKAKELIGKKAIRTSHCVHAGGMISRSFMDGPILILNATDSHIVYEYPKENSMSSICKDINKEPHILPYEYCDDNWTDYDELVSLKPEPYTEAAPFDWGAFKDGKIAVHCDTEDKAREFAKECEQHELFCIGQHDCKPMHEMFWDTYKSDTCFVYQSYIQYGGSDWFTRNNYTIIDYPFTSNPEIIVTREMLVKLHACSDGIKQFDNYFPSGKGAWDEVMKSARLVDDDVPMVHAVKWLEGNREKIEKMQGELGFIRVWRGYPAVSRWAKVGEWVYITKEPVKGSSYGGYDKGKIYKVLSVDSTNGNAYIEGVTSNFSTVVYGTATTIVSPAEYLVLDGYKPEPEKPKYYSGKVFCSDVRGGNFHTDGHIYEVIDGILFCDDGKPYNTSKPYESFSALCASATPEFKEVLE